MLRCIKKLREEHPETIVLKVLERLSGHPAFQGLIRFTWSEIEGLLAQQNRLQSTQPDVVFLEWRSRLTQAEVNLISTIPKISPEGEKMDELRRRHSTLTEKTTRYVNDILSVVLQEERLRDAFEKLQSQRSKVGMGDNTFNAIEHRFARTPAGDIRKEV